MDKTEKTINKNYVFRGRIINVRRDDVLLSNGRTTSREVVEHRGGCGILAVDDGKMYFVRQYRYPFERETLEIPAGKLEQGEEAKATAVRELKEEIGAEAESIRQIGRLLPTPGYSSETIWGYLAEGLSFGQACPDEDEFLDVVTLSVSEAVEMVRSGEISDAKTAYAVLYYANFVDKK